MNLLPAELLQAVINEIPSPGDILNVRLVNKTLCVLATPRAFQRAPVKNTMRSVQGFHALLSSQIIARNIQEVAFRDVRESARETGVRKLGPSKIKPDGERAIRDILTSAFSKLHELPKLETLTITFSPHVRSSLSSTFLERPLSSLTQVAILRAFTSLANPLSLKSLTIDNLIASHSDIHDHPAFIATFNKLAYLRITILSNIGTYVGTLYQETLSNFWSTTMQRRILAPSSASYLTCLSLHSDHEFGILPQFTFSELCYPLLDTLSIRGAFFADSVGIEDFIVRHRGTLRSLELRFCKIYCDDDVPDRFWSQVWSRFAKELDRLTVFKAEEEMDMVEMPGYMIRYAYFDAGVGYIPIFNMVPADDVALDTLKVVVASRSNTYRPPTMFG